jgi:hypothetical protein
MELDLKKVDNMEFDGIDHKDYPDYCDAYCCGADYDGVPMTDEQLEELNDEHRDFVSEKLWDYLH